MSKHIYGIFEEIKRERATLHLEYSEKDHLEEFSENTLTYVERSRGQSWLGVRKIFSDLSKP